MRTVGEFMSTEVVTVAPEHTLRSALELLAEHHIGGVPVISGPRVVGVLSMSDILLFQAFPPARLAEPDQTNGDLETWEEWREGDPAPSAFFGDPWPEAGGNVLERLEQTGAPEWDLLAKHTVGEVMTRRVIAVGPGTALRVAARLMSSCGIHRLLVLEEGRLRGVLSTMDVIRAAGRGEV